MAWAAVDGASVAAPAALPRKRIDDSFSAASLPICSTVARMDASWPGV